MKTLKFNLFATLVLIFLGSCNSDDGGDTNNLQGVNSQICANVQGPAAIYWDFANGIPAPLTAPPLITNPGQQFIHSQLPLLGFTIPQGFTAFEITEPQTRTLGVNVLRNDNAVVFRWIPNSFVTGQISSQAIIANEINTMLNFYGFNGTPEVLCSQMRSGGFEGIPIEFNGRLLRFGNIIGQVWVNTTFVAGGTAMAISVTAAPANEYDSQVMNTFLPINFQLFVRDNGNIVDQDGDGFTVLEDPDDNDPNVPRRQG